MMGINTPAKWDEEFHGQFYRWLGELITWGGKDGGGIQASRLCQLVLRIEEVWKKGKR
jgi:hypothetical protein